GRPPGLEVLVADEDDVAVALPLDGLAGDDDGLLLLAQEDAARAEGVGPEQAAGVGQVGPDLDGAGLLVGRRADPRDLAGDFLVEAAGAEAPRLAGRTRCGVAGAHPPCVLLADLERQPHPAGV